jgi:uncharacterized protein
MPRTPREIAEQVRKMVAGEGVVFADLFAADGVMAYPFAAPGQPPELRGREAIRAFFAGHGQARELFDMEDVAARVWETDDPEVVITEITHRGRSNITGGPYRFTALGIIRVRDGEIVRYDDYMDPIALARLLGRTRELATALSTT